MSEFKKITEEYDECLFENYHLTSLMLLKKDGKRIRSNENVCINILLNQKLEQYGLHLFGQFERSGLTFRGVRILENFPIENEPIFKQLYGYDNFTTHIQVCGFDDFALAFDYNVDNGECELQKHRFGSVIGRLKFNQFSQLIEHLKLNGYENAFE